MTTTKLPRHTLRGNDYYFDCLQDVHANIHNDREPLLGSTYASERVHFIAAADLPKMTSRVTLDGARKLAALATSLGAVDVKVWDDYGRSFTL